MGDAWKELLKRWDRIKGCKRTAALPHCRTATAQNLYQRLLFAVVAAWCICIIYMTSYACKGVPRRLSDLQGATENHKHILHTYTTNLDENKSVLLFCAPSDYGWFYRTNTISFSKKQATMGSSLSERTSLHINYTEEKGLLTPECNTLEVYKENALKHIANGIGVKRR